MADLDKVKWPGWETVGLIGRGSFGEVYEIRRKIFDDVEKAALKVITLPQNDGDIEEMYGEGYDDESITSTFKDHLKSIVAEYSLMRKMNGSSNIVNCDDVRYIQHDDEIGWDIFIKMELLTPLMKIPIDKINEKEIIKIAKDMCTALELCKKHDIVHRDIKPQNIFVSENGDYKLGDFGIAKTVERTIGGTKIGTYKYMAPEVYNNQPYGSAADIYSLGLVLYWLLNERRMPFLPLPPEKIKASQEDEARRRRFAGETLPAPKNGSDKLKSIVLKACAFEPKDRYTSASEMKSDLEKIGSTKTVPPKPIDFKPAPSPPEPREPIVRRPVGPWTVIIPVEPIKEEPAEQNNILDKPITEELLSNDVEVSEIKDTDIEEDIIADIESNISDAEISENEEKKEEPIKKETKEESETKNQEINEATSLPVEVKKKKVKSQKKTWIILASVTSLLLIFIVVGTIIINNKSSWQTIDGKKYYYSDGVKQTGWQTIDGKKYYFSYDGVMQTKTGWRTIDGKKYYFSDGGVVKTG